MPRINYCYTVFELIFRFHYVFFCVKVDPLQSAIDQRLEMIKRCKDYFGSPSGRSDVLAAWSQELEKLRKHAIEKRNRLEIIAGQVSSTLPPEIVTSTLAPPSSEQQQLVVRQGTQSSGVMGQQFDIKPGALNNPVVNAAITPAFDKKAVHAALANNATAVAPQVSQVAVKESLQFNQQHVNNELEAEKKMIFDEQESRLAGHVKSLAAQNALIDNLYKANGYKIDNGIIERLKWDMPGIALLLAIQNLFDSEYLKFKIVNQELEDKFSSVPVEQKRLVLQDYKTNLNEWFAARTREKKEVENFLDLPKPQGKLFKQQELELKNKFAEYKEKLDEGESKIIQGSVHKVNRDIVNRDIELARKNEQIVDSRNRKIEKQRQLVSELQEFYNVQTMDKQNIGLRCQAIMSDVLSLQHKQIEAGQIASFIRIKRFRLGEELHSINNKYYAQSETQDAQIRSLEVNWNGGANDRLEQLNEARRVFNTKLESVQKMTSQLWHDVYYARTVEKTEAAVESLKLNFVEQGATKDGYIKRLKEVLGEVPQNLQSTISPQEALLKRLRRWLYDENLKTIDKFSNIFAEAHKLEAKLKSEQLERSALDEAKNSVNMLEREMIAAVVFEPSYGRAAEFSSIDEELCNLRRENNKLIDTVFHQAFSRRIDETQALPASESKKANIHLLDREILAVRELLDFSDLVNRNVNIKQSFLTGERTEIEKLLTEFNQLTEKLLTEFTPLPFAYNGVDGYFYVIGKVDEEVDEEVDYLLSALIDIADKLGVL